MSEPSHFSDLLPRGDGRPEIQRLSVCDWDNVKNGYTERVLVNHPTDALPLYSAVFSSVFLGFPGGLVVSRPTAWPGTPHVTCENAPVRTWPRSASPLTERGADSKACTSRGRGGLVESHGRRGPVDLLAARLRSPSGGRWWSVVVGGGRWWVVG